jgi:hypothetical protein
LYGVKPYREFESHPLRQLPVLNTFNHLTLLKVVSLTNAQAANGGGSGVCGQVHYPYLLQQRRGWFVRMVVPADVRDIIGQSIFKVPTGHTDQHRAATAGAPIIAELQDRIRSAREAGKRLEQVTVEQLAERYRPERLTDPEKAEITGITGVINVVFSTQGHPPGDSHFEGA